MESATSRGSPDTPAAMRRTRQVPTRKLFVMFMAVLMVGGLLGPVATAQEEEELPDRVEAIIDAMTLAQKQMLITGGGSGGGAGATRSFTVTDVEGYGNVFIPQVHMADGPAGCRIRSGINAQRVTAMPAGVSRAASFKPEVGYEWGEVAGLECYASAQDVLLAPMINIVRVPEAGRNFETLGEDPFLAGEIVVAETMGIQNQGVMATLKHYAANSFENNRGSTIAYMDERTARESYLYHYEQAIKRADAAGVMCAYNGVNGEWSCASQYLLQDVLREDWGSDAWVVTDWGASNRPPPTADFVKAGMTFEMSSARKYTTALLNQALAADPDSPLYVTMDDLDELVRTNLRAMEAYGMLDEGGAPGVRLITDEEMAAHRAIAEDMAVEGATLLKNGGLLPLDAELTYAVSGAANNMIVGGGGSSSVNAPNVKQPLTALQERGLDLVFTGTNVDDSAAAAAEADAAIVFVRDPSSEFSDRTSLNATGNQNALVAAVAAANPNTIVVLNTGHPVLMPWAGDVASILQMWFPGREGGEATARILFGDDNPGGKLPVTFAVDAKDYPATATNAEFPERYPPRNAAGGTTGCSTTNPCTVHHTEGIFFGYRWFDANDIEPLFPFGHGLSYTQFEYRNLRVTPRPKDNAYTVSFTVRNVGDVAGDEVAQVYLGPPANPPVDMAERALVGFERVSLAPGERATISIDVGERQQSYWSDELDDWQLLGGFRSIEVGSSSRDIRLTGQTNASIGAPASAPGQVKLP
jgi:beta-glucosidase